MSSDERAKAVEAKARATAALRDAQRRLPGRGRYALAGVLFGLSLPSVLMLCSVEAVVTALLAAAYWLFTARLDTQLRREIAVLDFERRRADEAIRRLDEQAVIGFRNGRDP